MGYSSDSVETKIKLVLVVILVAVVAAAVFLLTQKKSDEFEIFSNLPTENASVIMQFNLNEKSFGEMSKIIGSGLGGGLKDVKGAQVGIVLSNDSSGIIIYVGTNMTVSDIIKNAGIPSYMVSSRKIGGKAVTVVEPESGVNAVCLWNDGEWLKILTIQSGVLPYLALSNMSEVINYKPAHAEECYEVMQTTYDTGYVKEFFQETDDFKKRIIVNGEYFGEMRSTVKDLNLSLLGSLSSLTELQMGNFLDTFNKKSLNETSYMELFGDNDGDYAISISHSGFELSWVDKLPCYNISSEFLTQSSEIVKNGGEEACLSRSKVQYGLINIEFVGVTRQVGSYSLSASAYVKGDDKKVVDYIEGFVFSQNFSGEEKLWTDKVSPKVRVFEGLEYQLLLNSSAKEKPLEGVNVSLYTINLTSSTSTLTSPNSKGSFIETAMTNSLGEADFHELPASIYYVEANKVGYTKAYGTINPGLAYTALYMQPIVPLEVKVTDESSGLPLIGAKVDLYSGSALLNTSYTDNNGIASFGNITFDFSNMQAWTRVIVNENGYEEGTTYILQGTEMPVRVELAKS